MLDKFTREFFKGDGDGEGEEMSEEAPLEMDDDDVIEIIDPEGLLISDEEEDGDDMSNGNAEEDGLEDNENAAEGSHVYVPERDDSKLTFSEHTGSVFCCDIDKTGQFAVTGGEDDKAYVWDLRTGEVKLTCKDNRDSVISAKFNHDGSLVAVGDMVGKVQVWKVASQEKLMEDAVNELNWMEWHPAINVLFAGAADGNITFWRVNSGECKILASVGISTDVGKIMPDGTRAVVGYEDGSVRIFDLRTCKSIFHTPPDEDPIKSMDCHRDNTLVLAGSACGEAKIINTRNGKVLGKLLCTDPNPACVESVQFCPLEGQSDVAACVTTSGDLSIWGISRQEVRDAAMLVNDATKIAWSKTDRGLIMATVMGDIEVYDGLDVSKDPKKLLGHSATVLDFCQSPDGKLLLSVSDDQTAKVFEMPAQD